MSLRINEVAQAAGVNRETLRYYERRGLLEKPDRSPGGHRLYDDRAVQTLRVVKAGCNDLHTCATSDCCPLPFTGITTRKADT